MKKYTFYSKFWFSWLVVTVAYLLLMLWGLQFGFVVGLFTPFGWWNTITALSSFRGIVSFGIFVFFMIYVDRFAEKLGLESVFERVAFNLVALFVCTILVDFSLWGQWKSLEYLSDQGHVSF